MWLDNLKELKKEKNLSTKQLAERSNLPEKTVARILAGQTTNPYMDTLDRLAMALGCTLGDILAGTKAVVGDTSLTELQATINIISSEKEELVAQLELVIKDNNILSDKVSVLTKELELTNLKLMYTEKLLATHDYYNKLMKD